MNLSPAAWLTAVWASDGIAARALTPLSWAFAAATGLRNLAYDLELFRSRDLGLPAVSVGNLSVGGTGKTPMSAWVAQRYLSWGGRPAIVLRGYGDDEQRVHARLTPDAVVIADPDRVEGAARARSLGASVLVLDDAFQHRRARRDLDLVLVAAEQGVSHRLLPAGPLREGAGAVRRAGALVITRKHASEAVAEGAARRWSAAAPGVPVVIAALRPGALHPVGASVDTAVSRPLRDLAGKDVLAISAIGAPQAFEAQLTALNAHVAPARFADHHRYSDEEITALARRAEAVSLVICTLKDAVKLEHRWPRQAPPMWYLSQSLVIERGEEQLDALLRPLLAHRSPN